MKLNKSEKATADKILRFILNEGLAGPFIYAYGVFMPLITALMAAALIHIKVYYALVPLAAAFILWLLQYIALVRLRAKAIKAVEELAARGELEHAAQELEDPSSTETLCGGSAALSEHYIFVRGTAALARCEDIAKVYIARKSGKAYIAVSTTDGKELLLGSAGSEDEARRCAGLIASRCPDIKDDVGNNDE